MWCIRENINIFSNKLQNISLKNSLYAKVMRTKKKAMVLLQSNRVGLFDCDHIQKLFI
jgi:hypothetical protein